jgi:hypothetical protein
MIRPRSVIYRFCQLLLLDRVRGLIARGELIDLLPSLQYLYQNTAQQQAFVCKHIEHLSTPCSTLPGSTIEILYREFFPLWSRRTAFTAPRLRLSRPIKDLSLITAPCLATAPLCPWGYSRPDPSGSQFPIPRTEDPASPGYRNGTLEH